MDLSSTLYEKLLRPSPNRASDRIRGELEQRGNTNAIISYHIQKRLHEEVFTDPEYPFLDEAIRIPLRRIHSIAFDGLHPTQEECERLLKDLESLHGPIFRRIHTTITDLHNLIGEEEAFWQPHTERYGTQRTRLNQASIAADLLAKDLGGRIGIFGSARRIKPGYPEYEGVQWLTHTLISGWTDKEWKGEQIITGAGPAFMEAGNHGAMEGSLTVLKRFITSLKDNNIDRETLQANIQKFRQQFHSIGIRITLSFEAGWNDYLQLNLSLKNFATRKYGLVAGATGRSMEDSNKINPKEYLPPHDRHPAFFVFRPGFGTSDETWEILCLMQTGKMPRLPVFIVGEEARSVFERAMLEKKTMGTIDPEDMDFVTFCANEVEALQKYIEYYKLPETPQIQEAKRTWTPRIGSKTVQILGNGNGGN